MRTDYRGYIIYDKPESFKPAWARFEFQHKDFDLDDTRYGHAATLEEAKAEIDEQIGSAA